MQIGYSLKTIFLIFGLCLANILSATPKMVDRVAAVVNNDVILESSVNNMLTTIKSNTDPNELPSKNSLRSQIIDRLIIESLILQVNEKANIKITDEDVAKTIENIAKQHNLSVKTLTSRLAEEGMNFNDYRERIRREMIIEETKMNEVRRRISITPLEVDSLAKIIAQKPTNNIEVNVSHILIAIPESPTPVQIQVAQVKANQIVKKLKQGEKFARLAATYSNDDLALSGGNLNWKKPSELPSLFEKEVITAHKNEIIGPLQSGVGFHILKVNDVRQENKKSVTVLETNARHILLKTSLIFDDKQAKAKLVSIRQDILNNKMTFDLAAKKFSEDAGSKNKGGELGWSMPDRYDNAFRVTLLKLKKGEISQPIKSNFGWHLIQLLDTRKVDHTDLAQKYQAYQIIFNRKFSEESQIWIQELKANAYINIMDDK